jgi:hypothetical protein
MPKNPNPHGDDQGTRVGSPDPADPSRRDQSSRPTGAGSEAAEGIHSADDEGGRANDERPGSEPLVDRETEHRSGYGGAGGKPKRSSDKRREE